MTALERRYRRVLRLLPASYRRAWEEDMVATFMASTLPGDPEDAEFTAAHGRPPWAEVASVAGLAVRLRLGGAGAPARSLAWGEAVRRVALVGLLLHAVDTLAGFGMLVWWSWRLPDPGAPDRAWMLTGLGWVVAYLLLVFGRWRAARVLAVLALLATAVVTGMMVVATEGVFLTTHSVRLLVDALPVLALAAFHREAVPVRIRPWLIALPVGGVLVTAALVLTQSPGGAVFMDWSGLLCVAVVAAALTYRWWAGRAVAWPIALAVLAIAALALRVATLLDYLQFAPVGQNTLIAAAMVEAVAMLVVAIPLTVRAVRTLPASVA